MSRELLDVAPDGDLGPGPRTRARSVDDQVDDTVIDADLFDDGTAEHQTHRRRDITNDDDAADDETDDATEHERLDRAGPPRRPSAATASSGRWWRRPVPLGAATVVGLVTLIVGLVGGTGQGRADERRAALAQTRLVVLPDLIPMIPGESRVRGNLRVLSVGGPVQLVRLSTPYGQIPIRPAVTVSASDYTTVPIDVIADCSGYQTYSGALFTDLPRTGTAIVRDRDGGAEREVPALLDPTLVGALVLSPCSGAQPSTDPGTTVLPNATQPSPDGTDGSGRTPVELSLDGIAAAGKTLSLTLRLTGNTTGGPVDVDVAVLDESLAGTGPGQFQLAEDRFRPIRLIEPGSEGVLRLTLTYRCRPGPQRLPNPRDLLTLRVTRGDGSDVGQWSITNLDFDRIASFVMDAVTAAGCGYDLAPDAASDLPAAASSDTPTSQASFEPAVPGDQLALRLAVEDLAVAQDGTLSFLLRVARNTGDVPFDVELRLDDGVARRDRLRAEASGNDSGFSATAQPPFPLQLAGAGDLRPVSVQFSYRCNGSTSSPALPAFPGNLVARRQVGDRAVIPAAVEGWDPTLLRLALLRTMTRAGCPPSSA